MLHNLTVFVSLCVSEICTFLSYVTNICTGHGSEKKGKLSEGEVKFHKFFAPGPQQKTWLLSIYFSLPMHRLLHADFSTPRHTLVLAPTFL